MHRLGYATLAIAASFMLVAPTRSTLADTPVLAGVEPTEGYIDEDTEITLGGEGFEPEASVTLLGGGPYLLGRVSTPDASYNVALSGGYAYVAEGTSGLQVVDISSPTAPTIAGPRRFTGPSGTPEPSRSSWPAAPTSTPMISPGARRCTGWPGTRTSTAFGS